MNKILSYPAVLLCMISCSNNEVIDSLSEQNEIRFANVQMNNSIITKAPADQAHSFGVYAFLNQTTNDLVNYTYFSNQKLSKQTEGWGLDKKFYYPSGAFSMNFIGYGKAHTDGKTNDPLLLPTSVGNGVLTYENFTIPRLNDGGQDTALCEAFVVTEYPTIVEQGETTTSQKPIVLEFQQALAKTRIRASVISNPKFDNVVTTIKSVRFKTATTADLTVGPAASWKKNAKTTYEHEYLPLIKDPKSGLCLITEKAEIVTEEYYLIPAFNEHVDNMNRILYIDVEVFHKDINGNPSNILVAKATAEYTLSPVCLAIANFVTTNFKVDLQNLETTPPTPGGFVEIKFGEPTIDKWLGHTDNVGLPIKPSTK